MGRTSSRAASRPLAEPHVDTTQGITEPSWPESHKTRPRPSPGPGSSTSRCTAPFSPWSRPVGGDETQVRTYLVQGEFRRSLYSSQPVPNGGKLLVEEGLIDPHPFDAAGLFDTQLQQRDVS